METTAQAVQKTWKPTVAGILNIVAGVLSLLGAICVIIGSVLISVGSAPFPAYGWGDLAALGIDRTFLIIIVGIGAVFLANVGMWPLIGGIYALQRKKWGLALAGSIVAILGLTPLGIAATILTALSKDEFE